ncbi:MAG: CHAT domain-containing protein [Microcoleaceae cyanobacterium]
MNATSQTKAKLIHQIDLSYATASPGQQQALIRQKYKLYIAYSLLPSSLPLAYCLVPTLAQAQPIVPAQDTGTSVHRQGNVIQIQGGRRVGGNLFHSFSAFDVHRGQTAQFASTETVRNILARVVSGEASIINGIIEVAGGNSNLYLINPAGIVFGAEAQLNVPASFVATTASQIEFDGKWYTATGSNDYEQLTGDPTAFAFPKGSDGVIVNEGELAVSEGESLTLLGGTVVSVGSLEAPGGQINLVAVPDEQIVRVSQNGQLLNLEIADSRWQQNTRNGANHRVSPLAFPKMLTGGNRNHAQGVSVNAQGQVVLSGAQNSIEVPRGTVVVAGEINTSMPHSVDTNQPNSPQLQPGGNIEIAGDHIVLSGAKIQATPAHHNTPIESQQNQNFTLGKVKLTSWSNSIEISPDTMMVADEIQVNTQPIAAVHHPPEPASSLSASQTIEYRLAKLKLNRFKTNEPINLPDLNPSSTHQAFNNTATPSPQVYQMVQGLETVRTETYNPLGNLNASESLTFSSIQDRLKTMSQSIDKNPAMVYVVSKDQQLEIILVTANNRPKYYRIPTANKAEFNKKIQQLIGEVSRSPEIGNSHDYLDPAQQLYDWMIAPLEAELQQQGIDTLIFSLDPGIRNFPLATLHDGESFLIKKYNLGLVPSLNLTDTRYQNMNNLSVLAMGASEFMDREIVDLPAVELELSMILDNWRGHTLLNQDFTLENLQSQREKQPFEILHLATHGAFNLRQPQESYLQLWDQKLQFEQLRQLNPGAEPLELLVLSACETAFGDTEAELGLAGLAVQTGVKSVLASLWQVDDAATLGLMSEFYRQLSRMTHTVKAEALRQAQIAMIEGDIRVETGQLRGLSRSGQPVNLPALPTEEDIDLSHPYYWASFVMVGSPW